MQLLGDDQLVIEADDGDVAGEWRGRVP
jgi:hypothetical protein